jgi:hypothetical protein
LCLSNVELKKIMGVVQAGVYWVLKCVLSRCGPYMFGSLPFESIY